MVRVDRHRDNTADGRVLNGVFHQVLEEHEQRPPVRLQGRNRGGAVNVHIHFAKFRQASQIIDDIFDNRGYVKGFEDVVLSFAGFGQMQELIDLARHQVKIAKQNRTVGGAFHVDLRADQSQRSFQFMGRAGQECALYDVASLQPVERQVEGIDDRKELDRKIAGRQALRYVLSIDACRGGGGLAQRLQYPTQCEINGNSE